jgi:hypothetical protein
MVYVIQAAFEQQDQDGPSRSRLKAVYKPVWHIPSQQQDQDVSSWSCSKAVYKPVWHIPLLSVQWITPDDGQRNCPKHVEFHSKNKFESWVHLVGFIIWKFQQKVYWMKPLFILTVIYTRYTCRNVCRATCVYFCLILMKIWTFLTTVSWSFMSNYKENLSNNWQWHQIT